MKYSLRSLMIVAILGPPVLSCLYFLLQPLFGRDLAAFIGILAWLLVFTLLVTNALLTFRSHP